MPRAPRHPGVWIRQSHLPTLAELRWLASPQGRAVCDEMATGDGADSPAAIERWRQRLAPEHVAAAWGQVVLRRHAAAKFERAAEMLFDRQGLEQASDETVARWKGKRFAGIGRVADFCCGIGGDAIALAAGRQLVGVDLSAERAAMTRHNVEVYGSSVDVQVGDAAKLRPDADAIHVDPDRRAGGRRRHAVEEGSPGTADLLSTVHHYRHAAIKLSPGAEPRDLPIDGEWELISHHGQCRQAVLWTGALATARRRASILPQGVSIAAEEDAPPPWPEPRTPRAGDLLYEPDAAVVRADLVGLLAERHALAPVDARIAYLVGSAVVDSPLLTGFRVLEVMPWSLKPVRTVLGGMGMGRLEIKTRGFAVKPEEILARLRLSGSRSAALFLTRAEGKPLAIIAERMPPAVGRAGNARA